MISNEERSEEIHEETVAAATAAVEEEFLPDFAVTDNDSDDKKIILNNIKDKLPSFSKEQKVAIASILPSFWTADDICSQSGKQN